MNSNRTTTTTTSAAHANRMMNCSFGSEMGNRSRGSLPGSSSCSDSSDSTEQQGRLHFGSFYLRLGAVAFGLGSMVYSGLEFGQFFELDEKEQCYSFLYGFTPTSHMVFTFFQLYFIFMNSKSLISKHRYLGKLLPFYFCPLNFISLFSSILCNGLLSLAVSLQLIQTFYLTSGALASLIISKLRFQFLAK